MRWLLLLLAACAAGDDGTSATSSDDVRTRFDRQMLARMRTAGVPGLAAVAIHGDRIVFARGYGTAELTTGRAVTPDTVFNVASISKTVAAVALMQRVEAGDIALDDDIDGVLPFTARHPSFPGTPITSRMLLSHTASMADSSVEWNAYVIGHDAQTSLETWLAGYLVPGGAYYTAGSWHPTRPGTTYAYANAGIDVAGELVEQLAGTDLQTYSQAQIFAPLEMPETSWFLGPMNRAHIAMPYVYGARGQYVAFGYECYPDYPNGQLRTSARQLARFLMMFGQGGELDGVRILAPATVAEMQALQPQSLEGLSWQRYSFGGHDVIGHSGVDNGVSTDMWLDPETGAGFIVLTNGDVYLAHWNDFEAGTGTEVGAMIDIETDLLELAESS
jgi:CubicO group peptidase (beta-lactamase class C family)